MKLLDKVIKLAEIVNEDGGRVMLVGGSVRDYLMGIEPKDFDCEVYNIQPNKLREILESIGKVDTVGQSFQVYKLDNEIDVSVPRRERQTGKRHTDFVIEGDPLMSYQSACSRRDFTCNSIMMDALTGEIIDPFNGQQDIKDRIIRHTKAETFVEDPLRVLRACQFASRFEFNVHKDTVNLCQDMDLSHLPKERVWKELEKLLLSKDTSRGFIYLTLLGVIDQLFPEIEALVGVQQDPIYHPEGEVLIHTIMVVEQARKLIDDLPYPEQITVMLSALCHDFGKPATTEIIDGRWRARGHEEAGIEPTISFLDRLGVHTIDGFNVREQVLSIVANHLAPAVFYSNPPSVGAFRRLANKVGRLDLLNLVSRADVLGRYKDGKPAFTTEAHDWFDEKIANLKIEKKGPDKLLTGKHLIALGMLPGIRMGEMINDVYEKQLDGEITTVAEAIDYAQMLLSQRNVLG